jgi:hypothetical protein
MNEEQIIATIQAALDAEQGPLTGASGPNTAGKRVLQNIHASAQQELEAAARNGAGDVQG